jgi:hypothetical protein
MNAIRNLLLITAITLGGIAACNYTVGECYYRGEGGGSGTDSVAAGGGVILPTGPTGGGGYGDEPPEQPQDALDPKPKCNSDEEPEFGKPATQYIDCRKRGLSALQCAGVCGEAGAACGPHAAHPYKSGQGSGQLIWCKNGSPSYVCDYAFPNGDSCARTVAPLVNYWLCSYAGGK